MNNKPFIDKSTLLLLMAYILGFGILLITTNHGDFVLWLNSHHSSYGDFFFKYWTNLGDGIILAIAALYFLFTNLYRFYYILIAIVAQTALVHLFKQWLWAGEPRPKTFFNDRLAELNFVDGVNVRGLNSFPSGHTATAFVFAFVLISLSKNRLLNACIFIAAFLVGMSRIYILQHFLRDVYVGSIFGILAALIGWKLMQPFAEKPRLKQGLIVKKAA